MIILSQDARLMIPSPPHTLLSTSGSFAKPAKFGPQNWFGSWEAWSNCQISPWKIKENISGRLFSNFPMQEELVKTHVCRMQKQIVWNLGHLFNFLKAISLPWWDLQLYLLRLPYSISWSFWQNNATNSTSWYCILLKPRKYIFRKKEKSVFQCQGRFILLRATMTFIHTTLVFYSH